MRVTRKSSNTVHTAPGLTRADAAGPTTVPVISGMVTAADVQSSMAQAHVEPTEANSGVAVDPKLPCARDDAGVEEAVVQHSEGDAATVVTAEGGIPVKVVSANGEAVNVDVNLATAIIGIGGNVEDAPSQLGSAVPPPLKGLSVEENRPCRRVFEVATGGFREETAVAHPAGPDTTTAPTGVGLHLSYALEDLQGSYTYLGNENFNTEGQCVWQRRVWHNVLAIKGSANSPSTDGAVITFVGQISDSRYYLLPDAGYRNPTTFTKSLADAKGTATLLCPPLASFGAHWETTYNNVKKLATAIATPGNPFKGALDSDKSIKVTYRPFLKKDSFVGGGDGDIDEPFRLENIPVHGDIAIAELAAMKKTHIFNILPAYDVDGNLILPKNYESALKGAVVVVTVNLKHYDFPTRGSSPASNTFVADVVKIRVLQPPQASTEKVVRKRVPTKDADFGGSSSKRARVA
ncbi:uncharacterized protein STEHIDRAFT_109051 [Stereum hirsutum FP-91666 SS1]|uniref:uncharacterized protein n=1 Tax=Stereum hirsutum (strain FP-91666) TaxID=721885 RepID=UPI000440DCAE|nr:uncharacterized protein STEHIDRAFT_109051 [Stereum hirsutum FP-91666 SS1]EIM88686.1 hypothetical protein STEHIDRAFT_109051 [Stereum hirsutum FP-91666 SS1]